MFASLFKLIITNIHSKSQKKHIIIIPSNYRLRVRTLLSLSSSSKLNFGSPTVARLDKMSSYETNPKGMDIQQVSQTLRAIAPLNLCSSWDNVGLLIEPSSPHIVTKLMLTNDLTQPVLSEAFRINCDMIVSYHPPIFKAHKRLTQESFKERLVVQCLENKVAVYSPHTCFDVANNGVNDWLIRAFGAIADVSPISSLNDIVAVDTTLINEADLQRLKEDNAIDIDVKGISIYHISRQSAAKLEPSSVLPVGFGRKAELAHPLTLSEAVDKVKKYIKLSHLRLALGEGKTLESPVRTVACCAGSGFEVLRDCDTDLYLTGEMSHHDVLHATSQGRSVILCEHSNSERGFLHHLQSTLSLLLPDVNVLVSQMDADPLVVV